MFAVLPYWLNAGYGEAVGSVFGFFVGLAKGFEFLEEVVEFPAYFGQIIDFSVNNYFWGERDVDYALGYFFE